MGKDVERAGEEPPEASALTTVHGGQPWKLGTEAPGTGQEVEPASWGKRTIMSFEFLCLTRGLAGLDPSRELVQGGALEP